MLKLKLINIKLKYKQKYKTIILFIKLGAEGAVAQEVICDSSGLHVEVSLGNPELPLMYPSEC